MLCQHKSCITSSMLARAACYMHVEVDVTLKAGCPCMCEWTVSSHSGASTSYSCLSFFSPLHLYHLFICRCLTVLIIALALAQHVLPKQDTEMEFEKEGVCGRL